MRETRLEVNGIKALLYGEPSDRVWLYVHGKCGYKEEAADFARFACQKGAEVLAADLPGHGERKGEGEELLPWTAVPELRGLMSYARERWKHVSLRANSIGAWLSMLAFRDCAPERSLFVSPVLDMEQLIRNMLGWAGVTEQELERRRRIPTNFGETLDWEYYQYARENRIDCWRSRTAILYAGRDDLTARATVDAFTARFGCELTVMERGEHWFHTPEQLEVLGAWTQNNC